MSSTDRIIIAFREQPELHSSFEAVVAEQKDKILRRVAAAESSEGLFRLQGELHALTNLSQYFKTMLGNNTHARTRDEARS